MTQMDLKCEVVSKGSNKGRTGFALCHNVIPRKNEIFYKFLFYFDATMPRKCKGSFADCLGYQFSIFLPQYYQVVVLNNSLFDVNIQRNDFCCKINPFLILSIIQKKVAIPKILTSYATILTLQFRGIGNFSSSQCCSIGDLVDELVQGVYNLCVPDAAHVCNCRG